MEIAAVGFSVALTRWSRGCLSDCTTLLENWAKFQPEILFRFTMKIGQSWKGTDQINLTEFYAKTRPQYIVAHCMLEYIDCRRLWTVKSEYISKFKFNT